MAHTNSTPNYNLPQFLPTDKPAWLVDVNPAYASIDAAIKNASDAAGNAQGDATQALSDAAGAQAIATQANTKADGAIASISEQFLDTATYTAGEYVIFNNILYVCTEPVTTPGPWTGSVNWTRASVDSIATELNNDINNLNDRTGSDIPVSDSDPTSIANAIDAFKASRITPTITNVHAGMTVDASYRDVFDLGSFYYIAIKINVTSSIGTWQKLFEINEINTAQAIRFIAPNLTTKDNSICLALNHEISAQTALTTGEYWLIAVIPKF